MQSIIPNDLIGVVLGYLPEYMAIMVQSFEEVTIDELKEMAKCGLVMPDGNNGITMLNWALSKGYPIDEDSLYAAVRYGNVQLYDMHTEIYPSAMYAAGERGELEVMDRIWNRLDKDAREQVDQRVLARRIIEAKHPHIFLDIYTSQDDHERDYDRDYELDLMEAMYQVVFDYTDEELFSCFFEMYFEEKQEDWAGALSTAASRGNMSWFHWLSAHADMECLTEVLLNMPQAVIEYPSVELVQWVNDTMRRVIEDDADPDIPDRLLTMIRADIDLALTEGTDIEEAEAIIRTIDGPFSTCYLAA